MTHHVNFSHPKGISRRGFLKAVVATGLLAGCQAVEQPIAESDKAPADTPIPTAAPVPTDTPAPTPTSLPTATSAEIVDIRHMDVTKMYPDIPSKVVHTHHAGVWDGEELVPNAIRQMLNASITELTGLNDATEAWAALFAPDERIAIKVNAFRNSIIWTHVPLVMAVVESLQEAGVAAEQIVIFDYLTRELEEAGFPVNRDGAGVRCYGTDSDYTSGWTVMGADIKLSDILLSCDALINMPVLKSHMIAGITFAMKNHYGTISWPSRLHRSIGRAIAELNSVPPIKDRTRLIIGDMLTACLRYRGSWPYWEPDWTGDSILVSFDPVAHDTVGLQTLTQLMADNGHSPDAVMGMATPCLESAAELGLGTNDPEHMEVVEINLG